MNSKIEVEVLHHPPATEGDANREALRMIEDLSTRFNQNDVLEILAYAAAAQAVSGGVPCHVIADLTHARVHQIRELMLVDRMMAARNGATRPDGTKA